MDVDVDVGVDVDIHIDVGVDVDVSIKGRRDIPLMRSEVDVHGHVCSIVRNSL